MAPLDYYSRIPLSLSEVPCVINYAVIPGRQDVLHVGQKQALLWGWSGTPSKGRVSLSWNLAGHRGFGWTQRGYSNRSDGPSEKAGQESTDVSGRLFGGLVAALGRWRVNCMPVWSLNLIVWGWETVKECWGSGRPSDRCGEGDPFHQVSTVHSQTPKRQ